MPACTGLTGLWLRALARGARRGTLHIQGCVCVWVPLMPPQARSRAYHAGGTEGWERWTGGSPIEARAPACVEAASARSIRSEGVVVR